MRHFEKSVTFGLLGVKSNIAPAEFLRQKLVF